MAGRLKRVAPAALLLTLLVRARSSGLRIASAAGLVALWTAVYAKYRREGRAETAREYERLSTADWESYTRHYNERVPTIEEEFDMWGPYHQHRHEMRYDLVARQVRENLCEGGAVLDVGCGSALVADRLADIRARYVGVDFGGHHITYAAKRYADSVQPLAVCFAQSTAERLPFEDHSFDVVVMSEVIEHLLRPELAVWEVARVLKRGGVFVMTTNNASEVPLRSPLTHVFAWAEKVAGAYKPSLISRRPWVWPEPVPSALVPDGADEVHLPHTHHIFAETRDMFGAAGLDVFRFTTFEFPPAQSDLARWFEAAGAPGKRAVDVLEAIAHAVPGVNKLGAHMLVVSCKTREPVATAPPVGVWSGPFSGAA